MAQETRYWQAKRVTLIGAFINAFLGCIKLIGGIQFHSHGLFADGIHSLSDLLTDFMVLFASKYGSQDADDTHPYGHQRIETAATLLLALLLILAGAGIAWDSFYELIHGDHKKPGLLSLPIVLFSIVANEGLYHYTKAVGTRIQSTLITANAWHHRSDAGASLIVLIGLIGTLVGYIYWDAVAALLVGLLIIKMGCAYGWNSVKELVDTGVDADMFEAIHRIIQHVSGVQRVHQLRSRMMGQDIFVDVHILVSPYLSVSEGHYIAQHVHHALMDEIDRIKDVTVHVDPEDDEADCPSFYLPSRAELEKSLLLPWQKQFPGISRWVLHYLAGEIIIDLYLNAPFDKKMALNKVIQETLKVCPEVQRVRIFEVGEIGGE